MSESEDDLKDDFFMEVLIDMGYVRMRGGWEIDDVDGEAEEITFKRS